MYRYSDIIVEEPGELWDKLVEDCKLPSFSWWLDTNYDASEIFQILEDTSHQYLRDKLDDEYAGECSTIIEKLIKTNIIETITEDISNG